MPIKYDEYVKRPREEVEYSPENIEELMKCAESCKHFLKYIKIVHPDKGEIPFDPYEYQLEIIDNLQFDRYVIGLWSRQSGKALSLDTPIPQPNGKWTTMGDIKIGDVILGKDGNPTTVTFATEIMYNHDCYEIEFDNQEKIIADKEHLWKVGSCNFKKRLNGERISHFERIYNTEELVNELKKSKYKSHPMYINYHDGIKNKKINLPIDPYTLGLWISDGHSANGRISTNKLDYTEISKNIKKSYKISEFKNDKRVKNGGYFNIYKLITDLKKVKLINNKHIPKIYFKSNKYQRLELLRGLLDGDGNCSNAGSCEFYQKDYNLILQVKELLSSLGIKSRIRDKKINEETYYIISFTTRKFYIFNLTRKRKLQKICKNHPKNNRIYIKDIRKVDSVPVRCIQVNNDDHLFLCGKTMIPTHNTTIVGSYCLWYAMFNENKVIGIVSNKESSAKMILSRIKRMYEALPIWLKPGVVEYSKTFITFDNGTKIRIAATSEDAFRGESINILVCDEFAFVPGHQAEEFWAANYPTISASREAKIIIISTPNGLFNIFHRIWVDATNGINSFTPTKVSWERVPDRDETWAEEQKANLGQRQFAQEFAVDFIGSTNTLIEPIVLESILNQRVEPIKYDLGGRLRVWEHPKEKTLYILGVDPAKGSGEHYSTVQVLRIDSIVPIKLKQIAVFQDNTTDVYSFSDIIDRLSRYYNNGFIMVENNGEGSSVVNRLWWTHENENLVNSGSKENKLGIRSTGGEKGTKIKAALMMKKLIEDGSLQIVDESTLKELGSFIEENGKLLGKDMPDDLVCALLWGCYLFEMNVLDKDYKFIEKEDDAWGILSDIVDNMEEEDWSWLDGTTFSD